VFVNVVGNRSASAEAASTPGSAATAAAAAATTAGTAASATAATTAPAAPGQLNTTASRAGVFLVEKMERSETDVSDFFFAESERLSGHVVGRQLNVRGRYGRRGRASNQRESQTGGTQCRNGGFGNTLRLGSLFHPLHRRILH
jgi:hypothetical protein